MLSRATFDSREIRPGMTFVALKGEKADGRNFIQQALAAGAARIITGEEELWAAAREKRAAMKAKVVGVTGSAGKTTTKELLRAFFSRIGRTYATQGNFNNHIGLPLTILNAPDDAEYLVLEMGTNHPGEIAHLCSIASPDAGVLTNVGTAHIENYASREELAREKFTLCASAKEFAVASSACFGLERFACPRLAVCDVEAIPEPLRRAVSAVLPGAHNISNAALAFAAAERYGLGAEDAAAALKGFALPGARWRVTEAGGVKFVDDSYNANPESMIAALDAFAALPAKGRRIAILGDMLELGPRSPEYHAQVFDHAASLGLDLVVAVGAFSGACRAQCKYENAAALKAALPNILEQGDSVLLKASHGLNLSSAITP